MRSDAVDSDSTKSSYLNTEKYFMADYKTMTTAEIREDFLSFFESKGLQALSFFISGAF